MPSSLVPSVAISLPSTVPVTPILPVTLRACVKLKLSLAVFQVKVASLPALTAS